MMRILTTLIALSLASPALAGDMTPTTTANDTLSVFVYRTTTSDTPPTIQQQITAALSGGCGADFITFDKASYCNAREFGCPMGSKGGE